MGRLRRSPGQCVLTTAVVLSLVLAAVPAFAIPEGQLTWAVHDTGFEFCSQAPAPAYDPAPATPLLAETRDADGSVRDAAGGSPAEAVANHLRAVGIRIKLRPLERAPSGTVHGEQALTPTVQGPSGASGSEATPLEASAVPSGTDVQPAISRSTRASAIRAGTGDDRQPAGEG